MRSFGPHYRLQVLNAESFEEKLTSVYKELEISPDDYLPVNYRVENEMLYVQMFKACFGIKGVMTMYLVRLVSCPDFLWLCSYGVECICGVTLSVKPHQAS